MEIRTLDLFSGGGGSSWGARAAGAQIVCGVDAWQLATEVYERNFGHGTSRRLLLTSSSTAQELGDVGRIDLLLASPECTNHTCARGSRPRDEESKQTANHVVQFARELDPRWIVVENVVHMKSWSGYRPFLDALRSLGYHLRIQDLNAADFGVPQNRRRLFILADKVREPNAVQSDPGRALPAKNVLDPEGLWKSSPLRTERRAKGTLERAERAVEALGPGKPFLIVYYGSDGSGGWQSLDKPLRTMTTLDRFGLVTWRGSEPMLRMLQVPELLRAMGFDASYQLLGTRRDQIKILGNGVSPPVMRAIVETLTEVDAYAVAAE